MRKTDRATLNATNAYLLEMTRAILKDRLDTDVYITQAAINSGKEKKVASEIQGVRSATLSQKDVSIQAPFTSIEFPRRYGHASGRPLLPRVAIWFRLTNEEMFRHWRILECRGSWWDFYAPKLRGKFDFNFAPERHQCPAHLLALAEELEHRRPTAFWNGESGK
ncbi:MAG: hypothetical protein UY47_C0001G0023 [Parcubacteria group bacterium GW2011_GWB1_49_7]|uniref:Uncharacterized protein n=1 Tax=Candidatus Zambryskibacteria bacterium RIFCSPHIGHO2_01_FULL_46_25 TaxID=1802738 RepID=A0A1G2SZM2_9BACT|nr:MAG: hypothetical protein UY47_C0001G0023 [Parcubacteria group bacterium GW2011_GWB1_49_7]OHA90445.1 MAG: hypothetical protein A2838_02550 [Candidatus Zambryskibacteria bacterium RIFCSPHIGHO2_01_FULL_46_25]OHB00615.1 MAG: hypothetical protein A3F53_01460 [Candidatus Zambryskibacteria bacterium RIFCSPHIGHO2_12_FULL_48_10]OHB06983.1 MAG: hypothetical protein A3A31_01685 [Candidatus Zambryskibacteria bacterium RIFCSPLOWO2_01_FULL_48_25]